MKIVANDIQLEVEDAGGEGTPVLLIMGLGGQLIHFPDSFVRLLGQSGHRAIRFDNRDAGLSQHLPGLGTPHPLWAGLRHMVGATVHAPYTLHDMAQDALGVLDALGIARAHLVGVSMGGMIAQRMAIAAPARCATLTSIMSSSGARGLPGPRAEVLRVMSVKPNAHDSEAVVRYYLDFFRAIGGPAYAVPEARLREQVRQSVARDYDPGGNLRQMAAILADGTRANELQRVACPTLVLHGDADPFVRIECGRDTARRIPGARFVAIEGAGHDLAPAAFEAYARHLLPFLHQHPIPGAALTAAPLSAAP